MDLAFGVLYHQFQLSRLELINKCVRNAGNEILLFPRLTFQKSRAWTCIYNCPGHVTKPRHLVCRWNRPSLPWFARHRTHCKRANDLETKKRKQVLCDDIICSPLLHSAGRPIFASHPSIHVLSQKILLQSALGLRSVERNNKTKFLAISWKTRHFLTKSSHFDLFSPIS